MGKRDRITGVTFLIIGLAVIFHSLRALGLGTLKTPGAGFFPFLCGASIAVFSVIWLFSMRNTQGKATEPFWGKGEWIRPTIAVLLTIGYATVLDDFGFILTTFLFSVTWQYWVEQEKWLKNLAISLVSTAAMYTIFQFLLSVPLPRGMFS